MENLINIPFFPLIKFFLGCKTQSAWCCVLRHLIPVIFLIIFIIDFGDWIINGETNSIQGEPHRIRQSHIIAILSYMNSQFSFLLTCTILFGFVLKAQHLIMAIERMISAHLLWFGLKVNKRSPVIFLGYMGICTSALAYVTVFVGQLCMNVGTTQQREMWKPVKYFVWRPPNLVWDAGFHLVWLVARLLPFLVYILYFHLVMLVIQSVVKFNSRLQSTIIAVQQEIMHFEEGFRILRKEDTEIYTIVQHLSDGFSFVLGAGIFGHFLIICSMTAQAFLSDDFANVWEYAREVLQILPSAVILLMFFLTGTKLHESCSETIALIRDLILAHQDCRRKIPLWTDDAKLITFLYKISQRSGSLMLAGFAHLTRGTAATFLFAFIGYLCFLIERSEHYKTDEKLTGALKGNTTLGHLESSSE
ncbi:uncharacterized protein LOC129584007 [Paramacrobiotus metropolitanus]|uniref:uncharacterized protein LOC129584007 n=1 Tax=Paramacrobiotus metropolitanus TaxID=2943436 RepID=UPI002445D045|nr:uncharacterized protein LOC129584007 [Paramacrobiotus metropolitanus]